MSKIYELKCCILLIHLNYYRLSDSQAALDLLNIKLNGHQQQLAERAVAGQAEDRLRWRPEAGFREEDHRAAKAAVIASGDRG